MRHAQNPFGRHLDSSAVMAVAAMVVVATVVAVVAVMASEAIAVATEAERRVASLNEPP